jgi:2-succinyl-5-enolpyruvyl-6-hydroxy-3-cyclohexene-1-carboxylate synthase
MLSDNQFYATLCATELQRLGVTFVCISPGSRSTPITAALVRQGAFDCQMCLDERAAAFRALGYARGSGRPALLVCTSGSALAHYLPAVIEASQDQVPMLILSADRPPELLQTGANQAIEQVGIFGRAVRACYDLPCPDQGFPPEALLTLLDQAMARSLGPEAGPVHLNWHFREPLAPTAERPLVLPEALQAWQASQQPYTQIPALQLYLPEPLPVLPPFRRGLLVIGRLYSEAEQQAVRSLAQRLNWPVCADVLSGLASDPDLPRLRHFDPLLKEATFAAALQPDLVLHLGGECVSTRLIQHLKQQPPGQYVRVQNSCERLDSLHQITLRLRTDLISFCQRVCFPAGQDEAWRQHLLAAGAVAEAAIVACLAEQVVLNEPQVARTVLASAPAAIWIGNSMPVRDLDMFAPDQGILRIAANRGASGIEGHISAALGFAEGLHLPVTALIGDLALLHDLNALAMVKSSRQVLKIVVINNDGGGIFSFLPVAAVSDIFEAWFGTPHGLRFEAAAALFGLPYAAPTTAAGLQEALARPGSALIEVHTERTANHRLHQQLSQRMGQRLRSDWTPIAPE